MKIKTSTIILLVLIILTTITAVIFISTLSEYFNNKEDINIKTEINETEHQYTFSEANNSVINVDNDSTIRIITEYDKSMFLGHKSLIFFWASWCSHCLDEYDLVKKVINEYQGRGYSIYVISHDYDINDLAYFMKKNDLNYEVYFDETRIIRKNINPEDSSVPLTYILDESGKLIYSYSSQITFDILDDALSRYMY